MNVKRVKQALEQIYSEMLETKAMPVNAASSVLNAKLASDFLPRQQQNCLSGNRLMEKHPKEQTEK